MLCRSADVSKREAGSVTAELAIGLLSVTTVLAGLCSVVMVALAQVRVGDAAAAGARLAARGEAATHVQAVTLDLAGTGSRASVSLRGSLTTVTVTRSVPLALPGAPTVRVSGSSSAVTEVTGLVDGP